MKPNEHRRLKLTVAALCGLLGSLSRARIDMLSTGIRTPVGVKVFGPDLGQLAILATQVEQAVRSVPGTSPRASAWGVSAGGK